MQISKTELEALRTKIQNLESEVLALQNKIKETNQGPKYEIEIEYITGNSFGSETRTERLGAVFMNIECAKMALVHIKDHLDLHSDVKREYNADKKAMLQRKIQLSPWYHPDAWDSAYQLVLQIDTDRTQDVSAFWVGYFERLISAKIVLCDELNNNSDVVMYY